MLVLVPAGGVRQAILVVVNDVDLVAARIEVERADTRLPGIAGRVETGHEIRARQERREMFQVALRPKIIRQVKRPAGTRDPVDRCRVRCLGLVWAWYGLRGYLTEPVGIGIWRWGPRA